VLWQLNAAETLQRNVGMTDLEFRPYLRPFAVVNKNKTNKNTEPMKTFKNLKFVALTALAALAVTLLFQTPITRADDNRAHRGRDAEITFAKWVTAFPNQPGLIANMEGLGDGGAAGEGIFTGEVLKWDTSGPIIDLVAVYHFTGSKHAFTAVVQVTQPKTSPDGVIVGVITDGWLKGHALKGEYTVVDIGPNPFGAGLPVPYIPVTLRIDRNSND
jgi:hypothetical protein